MGYIRQGRWFIFFMKLTEEQIPEVNRLMDIFRRTKKRRIKNKIINRVDSMIKVSKSDYRLRVKPYEGIQTGTSTAMDWRSANRNADT